MDAENMPHETAVKTVAIVNPSAPAGKREITINEIDLPAWRAKGYRLASEPASAGTSAPKQTPTPAPVPEAQPTKKPAA